MNPSPSKPNYCRGVWRALLALGCSLLFGAPALLALDPAKSIFQFNTFNWTRQNGLTSDKISAITQTEDGYIWLGTQNGLLRFDGKEFVLVPVVLPEGRGQDVRKLAPASGGGLWLTASGSGGYFDGSRFSPLADARSSVPESRATWILEDRAGDVWIGSGRASGRWSRARPETTHFDNLGSAVQSITEDATGRVWMGTVDQGLFYSRDGNMVPFPDPELKKEIIRSIAIDREGQVWVGSNSKLRRYDAEWKLRETYFNNVQFNALLVDRQGILWAGTHKLGLLRIEKNRAAALSRAQGLGSENVLCLFEDREGSLWVGTQSGLSQLTDVKFPIFSAPEGLTDGIGLAVSPSRKGGLWVGTADGAAYLNGSTTKKFSPPGDIPANYVRRIFEARNGDVYLGDTEKSIVVLSDGVVSRRYPLTAWPDAFAEDAESVIVSIGPALHRIRSDRLEPMTFSGPVQPDPVLITNLCVATDGAIWAASSRGVFRFQGGTFQQWTMREGLSSERSDFIFQDTDGSIWAGMPTGLARIKDGRVQNIGLQQGLHDDKVFAIVPDDLGWFWIASGRGFYRVSRESLNACADGKVATVVCEAFDGLDVAKFTDRTDQAPSGAKTLDGLIWFPSPGGVMMIDPKNIRTNAIPPPVHIERVLVNGSVASPERMQALKVDDRNLEFDFAALSYISPSKVQIRYRLDGVDKTWVQAGSRRSAIYNKLAPGAYKFRVEACNADGVWNTATAEIAFTLPPPYYATPWFFGLCVAGSLAAVLGGYRWKVRHIQAAQRKLEAENDRLERKVGERTGELARSLSLLHATLESVTDGIVVIDLEGRVVSYNSKFAAIGEFSAEVLASKDVTKLRKASMHLLKNPRDYLENIVVRDLDRNGKAFDVVEFKDGRIFERYVFPQLVGDRRVGTVINWRDVTERKQAEAEVHKMHAQLLATSRQAGMADVATGVLHNVGNVLNSVNVSATMVMEQVRRSKATNIRKLSALFEEHKTNLAAFITQDPRGQRVPGYLDTLADSLASEHKAMLTELEHLRKNIEHIKDIVSMQQSYARPAGFTETLPAVELIEDALRMNGPSLARHEVELVRDFQAKPEITTDKHKVMQILVNLVRNAKHACDEAKTTGKRIVVRTTADAQMVKIAVIDNGVGIPAENLTRIFNHGFTTKKNGHGFGLHSGALAAKEVGGKLTVESAGAGTGATFTLMLPLQSRPAHDVSAA